jgi:hypothetical protein
MLLFYKMLNHKYGGVLNVYEHVVSSVQEKWSKNLYIAAVSYGRTVS